MQKAEGNMPRTYTRNFRVRYYECDPYGHVNNANYLRYATETALEASADAGYSWEKYAALGTLWLIREARVEYLRPVLRGATLTAKTWVEDFRRVRSRRVVELSLVDTGELAARVSLEWVYLNAKTQQPVRIPVELMAAFFPEGAPAEAPRRDPFPEPPVPPPGAYTIQRRVRWHQLDPAGHMNSAWYLSLMEEAVLESGLAAGWNMQRSMDEGIVLFAREHRVEYLRPALMDETFTVTTYISHVRRATALRHYVFRLASGEMLARAQTLWVWVDPASGRPTPIPPGFMDSFAGQIAAE